jgi:hypothetical protein
LDGQCHEATELLKVSGYKRTDTKAYREIIGWLKKLQLLEKIDKGFRFTDKMFQHGSRPN